jgi:nitrogen fixation/metabolism regulation signal transduction histidine kinase
MISGPIYDFSSDSKAVVEIIIDRRSTQAILSHYAIIAAAIALIGLVLSISFAWFVSNIFYKRIGDVVKGAQEIAAGSRNRIENKGYEELGWMALAINQMLTSLEVSRNKLSEYARDLDFMVTEGTKSLKESERTYRTLIENIPITVFSQISSRLAHELRNPLTCTGGLSRRLLKSFDADDPRRKISFLIIEQVKKAGDNPTDDLDLSWSAYYCAGDCQVNRRSR